MLAIILGSYASDYPSVNYCCHLGAVPWAGAGPAGGPSQCTIGQICKLLLLLGILSKYCYTNGNICEGYSMYDFIPIVIFSKFCQKNIIFVTLSVFCIVEQKSC